MLVCTVYICQIYIKNHFHERALRIVYKNKELSSDELLKKDGSFTIHQRNIKTLSMELFEI